MYERIHGVAVGRLVAVGLMLAMLLAAQCACAADAPPSVQLTIDYGDGVQTRFKALPFRQGMTVLDALVAAQKHPRGVKFVQRGKGAGAMVTELGGLKNEGSGKNWLYSVGGKPAEESAGIHELKPGDAILWEFKAYDYN